MNRDRRDDLAVIEGGLKARLFYGRMIHGLALDPRRDDPSRETTGLIVEGLNGYRADPKAWSGFYSLCGFFIGVDRLVEERMARLRSLSFDGRRQAILKANGLDEDADLPEDQEPAEMAALRAEYGREWDRQTAACLRDVGAPDLAELLENDIDAFVQLRKTANAAAEANDAGIDPTTWTPGLPK